MNLDLFKVFAFVFHMKIFLNPQQTSKDYGSLTRIQRKYVCHRGSQGWANVPPTPK